MKKTSFPINFFIAGLCISLLFVTGSCKKAGENAENHLPVADYVLAPARGDVTTSIEFDAGMVYDYEDPVSVLEVRWDWNRDNVFDTPFTTVKSASHQYNAVGVYFPLLEVRDLKGMSDTIKKMVVIVSDLSNMPPFQPIYLTPPEWQTWMDETITFKWTCSDPENDQLTFDLWTGLSRTSLQLVRSGITTFTMVDGEMEFETTISGFRFDQDYYWQIGAKDPVGNYTVGGISKFTTRPADAG